MVIIIIIIITIIIIVIIIIIVNSRALLKRNRVNLSDLDVNITSAPTLPSL